MVSRAKPRGQGAGVKSVALPSHMSATAQDIAGDEKLDMFGPLESSRPITVNG